MRVGENKNQNVIFEIILKVLKKCLE